MKTTIETTNTFYAGDIENSVEIAMNATNIVDFIEVLNAELPAYEILKCGSHIAIHRDSVRVAIITDF